MTTFPRLRSKPNSGIGIAILTDWSEIGGLGRFALFGVVGSLVVAVALGFSITRSAQDHLLESRAALLADVVSELAVPAVGPDGVVVLDPGLDEMIRLRLLGGETVAVKLWLRDGTIAYSDASELIGQTFELSEPARSAMAGEASHQVSDLSDPAHEVHRDLGRLIEFYVPFGAQDSLVGAFEVEQVTASLDEAMARIGRNVALSIGSGITLLALFLGALIMARARDLNRRRRQAEALVGSLLTVQDEERRRTVGSLHDDIGQPLYRLLYGIEGSRSKLDEGHPVTEELDRLADIVRTIDSTLRHELSLLHEGLVADAGLEPAIEELVEAVQRETDLEVLLEVEIEQQPASVQRAALYRATAEALTNVRKHANAQQVVVVVTGNAGRVVVEVVDDGLGPRIDPGLGLTTTRERLESIGGGLTVTSERGSGTRYRAWTPVGNEGGS